MLVLKVPSLGAWSYELRSQRFQACTEQEKRSSKGVKDGFDALFGIDIFLFFFFFGGRLPCNVLS